MNIKTKFNVIVICIFILIYMVTSSYADENQWSTNGPFEARVKTIAINPEDNQHILIGTIENGIYKSLDGGQNWILLEDDVLPNNMRHLEFHPTAPENVYASTIQGFYKSSDGGSNWQLLPLPIGWQFEIRTFAIHPTQNNLIFIEGGISGINYKSNDGGSTWVELNLPSLSLEKFLFNPLNDSIVYVASQSGISYKSVYRSNDLGETWTNIHNDLNPNLVGYNLAIDPVDTSTLYFCGRNRVDPTGLCLYKTTTSGDSWFDITPDILDTAHIYSITISPFDHNTLFICTTRNGVLKSANGGSSWSEINDRIIGRFARVIIIDSSSGVMYLGTFFDGIYRSLNYGETWEKISENIVNANCKDLCVNSNDSDNWIVTTENAMYISINDGISWDYIDIGIPNGLSNARAVEWDPIYAEYIYAGLYPRLSNCDYTGVMVSSDYGNTWNRFSEGLPLNTRIIDLDLSLNGTGGRRIFALTSSALYYSDDFGQSWQWASSLLPEGSLYDLAACDAAPNIIYVSDLSNNLYVSDYYGDNWELLSIPVEGNFVNEIVCDPTNQNVIYICKYGHGIYKTINSGLDWVNTTNDLPQDGTFIASGFAINYLNPDNIYVNVNRCGIFISNNSGETWVPFNEGLNTHYSIGHTIIDPVDTSRVYLATSSQSVWSITRTQTSIDGDIALPMAFSVSNYPNPFNASTNIKFTLPNSSDVKIDIYDMLGRRVSTIVNEHLFAGYHSVIWNPVDLSSGVYFYKIEAGEYETSQKMMLLR